MLQCFVCHVIYHPGCTREVTPTNQTDSVYFHTLVNSRLAVSKSRDKQLPAWASQDVTVREEYRNDPIGVRLGKTYLNWSLHSSQSPSRTVQIASLFWLFAVAAKMIMPALHGSSPRATTCTALSSNFGYVLVDVVCLRSVIVALQM